MNPMNAHQARGVVALGYLGLEASDVPAWRTYLADVLGVAVADHDGGLRARVDSRAWRIAVEPGPADDVAYVGWEVDGPETFERLIAGLQQAGVAVERPGPELSQRRGVVDVAVFADPGGLRCELFWGGTERFETPANIRPGVSGFVTGDMGLGHIVVATADPGAYSRFYRELLGFALSDYIDIHLPQRVLPIEFLHCNRRHHTLAFGAVPSPRKLLHFMLQVHELDDVGRALDRLKAGGGRVALGLGRHSNDHMLSFYAKTPSGFEVEYGWGARDVGPDWIPVRHDRTSSWGHEQLDPTANPRA